MNIAVRRGALDKGEVVIHGRVVVGGGAVPEAVVQSRGNQRCGSGVGRLAGCGGVVWFAQVVVVNVNGTEILRRVVKVKWGLVRPTLVVRVQRRGLRRCH